MPEKDGNSSFKETDEPRKKGKRGPAAGKWQNGKGCFSAWYNAWFIVALKRLAKNLGTDPASLVYNNLSPVLEVVRLTKEDMDEIRDAEATSRQNQAQGGN